MKTKNKKKWIKTLLVAAAFVLALALFFLFVQLYIDGVAAPYIVTADSAVEADAVIVLGALVYADERPSPVLEDRLLYAYELYTTGKAKKIIVSGDHGRKDYDEVNAMKEYLVQKGVPEADIFLDHAGFDTYDSMIRARDIFGVKTLHISTQNFHIRRAIYIARRLGIEAYGYASPDKPSYGMARLNLRESLAKIKAFWDTDIVHRAPKVGGESIPISGSGIHTNDR